MTAYIDPTGAQVKALAAEAESNDGPVVMLNLLKFKPGGGRDSFKQYAFGAQPFLEQVGAKLLYAGDATQVVIGGDEHWDAVLVVRYPSRAAFLEMVGDPGYQEEATHRTAALVDSRLIATDPW